MAAFLSRTVGLDACQLGSAVFGTTNMLTGDVEVVVWTMLGEERGELGALAGWVICMLDSRWEIVWSWLDGTDKSGKFPFFRVSEGKKIQRQCFIDVLCWYFKFKDFLKYLFDKNVFVECFKGGVSK